MRPGDLGDAAVFSFYATKNLTSGDGGAVVTKKKEIADRLRIGDRTVDVRVLEGRPATEIVVEAGRFRADLIVVGARGLSTVRRLLIGSVSSEVVDHAPCPVLVARRADVERVMLAIDASPSAAAAADYIAESGLFDEAKILEFDRAGDVPNCSVTSYEFDPNQGKRGDLALRLVNFVAPLEATGTPVTVAKDLPTSPKA